MQTLFRAAASNREPRYLGKPGGGSFPRAESLPPAKGRGLLSSALTSAEFCSAKSVCENDVAAGGSCLLAVVGDAEYWMTG